MDPGKHILMRKQERRFSSHEKPGSKGRKQRAPTRLTATLFLLILTTLTGRCSTPILQVQRLSLRENRSVVRATQQGSSRGGGWLLVGPVTKPVHDSACPPLGSFLLTMACCQADISAFCSESYSLSSACDGRLALREMWSGCQGE